MNEQHAVIRQALDALEYWAARDEYNTETREAITALYRLLEQPTEWVGLTDDEFNELHDAYKNSKGIGALMQRVEAKLREKNGVQE